MWTLTYGTYKAAVVKGSHYVWEFESREAVNEAVKNAEQIYVLYPNNRGVVMNLADVDKQQLRSNAPTSFPIE